MPWRVNLPRARDPGELISPGSDTQKRLTHLGLIPRWVNLPGHWYPRRDWLTMGLIPWWVVSQSRQGSDTSRSQFRKCLHPVDELLKLKAFFPLQPPESCLTSYCTSMSRTVNISGGKKCPLISSYNISNFATHRWRLLRTSTCFHTKRYRYLCKVCTYTYIHI